MTKDKQIEEMAKLLQLNYDMPYEFAKGLAEFLIDEGYRKASDLAREIFEEVDNILRRDASDYDDLMDSETVPEIYTEYLACSNYIYGIRQEFAELKKKYTESEKE